jgi:hypothetical protein
MSGRGHKRKMRSSNTLGYIGIRKTLRRTFEAQVQGRGSRRLGTFSTAKRAALAYDRAIINLKRNNPRLNFPDGLPSDDEDYDFYMNPDKTRRLAVTNTTGYPGVYKHVYKMGIKYEAQIRINRKQVSLGRHDTAKEAALAVDRAIIKHKLPSSKLNFPDGKLPSDDEDYEAIMNPKKKRKLNSQYTNGYNGVDLSSKRYRARIRVDGKIIYLGTFATSKEAALEFDRAVIQYGKGGYFKMHNRLNFPDMWDIESAKLKDGSKSEASESEASESEASESEASDESEESESEESESEESDNKESDNEASDEAEESDADDEEFNERENIQEWLSGVGVLDTPEKYKKQNCYEMSGNVREFLPHRVTFLKTEKRQKIRTTGIVVSKRTYQNKVTFSCYEDFPTKTKVHEVDDVTFIEGHDQSTLKEGQALWVRWMKKKNRGNAPAERKYSGVVTRVHDGNVYVKYHTENEEYLLHKGSQFSKMNLF